MLAWITLAPIIFLAGSEPDKGELVKLQGKWQVVGQEHGGKKSEAKAIRALTMEVSNVKMTVRDGVDIKEESRIILLTPPAGKKAGMLELKITAGPDMDKVVKGIYKLEGDQLSVSIAEPGKDRPTEFAGQEGTGHTLLVFKRVEKKD